MLLFALFGNGFSSAEADMNGFNDIVVAKILSGVHFSQPNKLTNIFSRRPQNTS